MRKSSTREEVETMADQESTQPAVTVKPLTDEEVKEGLEALKDSEALIERIRQRRKGKPLPSSWRLIRKAREERAKQI
jgi:hypothetical protein